MRISSFGVLASGLVLVVGVCACSSSSSDGGSGGTGNTTGGTSASAAGSAGKASTGGSSGSTSTSSGGSTSGGSGGASTAGAGGKSGASGGTGGGTSAGSAFSCERTADGTCASYSSVPPNSASTYCSDGTVVTTCPSADLQATCTFTSAGVDEVFYYYTSGGHSNAAIKSVCDSESGVLKTF